MCNNVLAINGFKAKIIIDFQIRLKSSYDVRFPSVAYKLIQLNFT